MKSRDYTVWCKTSGNVVVVHDAWAAGEAALMMALREAELGRCSYRGNGPFVLRVITGDTSKSGMREQKYEVIARHDVILRRDNDKLVEHECRKVEESEP